MAIDHKTKNHLVKHEKIWKFKKEKSSAPKDNITDYKFIVYYELKLPNRFFFSPGYRIIYKDTGKQYGYNIPEKVFVENIYQDLSGDPAKIDSRKNQFLRRLLSYSQEEWDLFNIQNSLDDEDEE